jgi:putative SOS response-associated peptidase YedK
MCSRFYRTTDLKDLYERFEIAEVIEAHPPQYNIAPTDPAYIIPATPGERHADWRIFGIINPFRKERNLLINMRAESFVHKPPFKPYLLNQRCVVIADGFIEWLRKETKTKKTDNYPYRFDARDHQTVGLAGVWHEEGFVIITTEPNGVVSQIHDRMPVILRREDEAAWLDASNKDFGTLVTMLAPYPAAAMQKAPIAKAASNSKNKQAEILTPITV